jgi:hypothetical protein
VLNHTHAQRQAYRPEYVFTDIAWVRNKRHGLRKSAGVQLDSDAGQINNLRKIYKQVVRTCHFIGLKLGEGIDQEGSNDGGEQANLLQ